MRLVHLRLTRTNLVAYVLFAVSAALLVLVVIFSVHITVLKDWRLELPSGPIHEGDTVVVESVYVKLRAVTGIAHRYIDCQDENGLYIRYPLNQATADRAPGAAGTGVILKMPTDIPGIPTTCRISINVTYKVYPWRSITEFASSNTFTLLPAGSTSVTVAAEPQATSKSSTSPDQASAPSQLVVSSPTSYPESAPPSETTPSEIAQPDASPTPAPSLSIINTLQQTLNGLGL